MTEAGFGAELGAEKFMDIKCRLAGLRPRSIASKAVKRPLAPRWGT
ncbi:formate--tetrahydrofolate ligase [Acetomicrobium sp. S15 = DSM 107314]